MKRRHFDANKVTKTFIALVLLAVCSTAPAASQTPSRVEIAARLKAAYPAFITAIDGNDIVFADGTKLPLDDGAGPKPFDAWLDHPDVEDTFEFPYPANTPAAAPAPNIDPGRARNTAFFTKIYGDCRSGGVTSSLVDIVWLPKKSGQRLQVTTLNGAAKAFEAVNADLDALPASFDDFLTTPGGTYNCRLIAGTESLSAHGYGIAIDIAVKHAHYWRWAKGGPAGAIEYQNAIPMEIVAIFEKHGFIWGGRWHHYDTMHFEYRPELIVKPQ